MPTVHFVCGATGSGKTMYSIALAQRARAVRFAIDEWMSRLFAADRPTPTTLEWATERAARCEAQMWTVADELLARGIDVVFDIGVPRREHRDRFRARASQTSALVKMHYLDVPRETRKARIMARNARNAGVTTRKPDWSESSDSTLTVDAGTQGFEITEEMFDWLEQWFEPPSDDELYGAMIVAE
jgi:predicted kinase